MKAEITVLGMHCSSCEAILKEAVQEIKGVKKAKANAGEELLEIEFDENKTSIQEIKKAVKKEGYQPK